MGIVVSFDCLCDGVLWPMQVLPRAEPAGHARGSQDRMLSLVVGFRTLRT